MMNKLLLGNLIGIHIPLLFYIFWSLWNTMVSECVVLGRCHDPPTSIYNLQKLELKFLFWDRIALTLLKSDTVTILASNMQFCFITMRSVFHTMINKVVWSIRKFLCFLKESIFSMCLICANTKGLYFLKTSTKETNS